MNNSLQVYIREIQSAEVPKQFDESIERLKQMLISENCEPDVIQNIRKKSQYLKAQFSGTKTTENMQEAKENVLSYLKTLDLLSNTDQKYLSGILHNFHLFMESFCEARPHKKATLKPEDLKKIQINNEYDLQHILFAILKPLFTDARTEVNEDTGYGTVRDDIKIPSLDTIIETKCTRANMNQQKLTEEISADITNYKAKFIYFLVYDKEKVVKNPQAFRNTYNRVFDGKQVNVILIQPVIL